MGKVHATFVVAAAFASSFCRAVAPQVLSRSTAGALKRLTITPDGIAAPVAIAFPLAKVDIVFAFSFGPLATGRRRTAALEPCRSTSVVAPALLVCFVALVLVFAYFVVRP